MTYLPAGPGGSAIEISVDFHLGTQMRKEPGTFIHVFDFDSAFVQLSDLTIHP